MWKQKPVPSHAQQLHWAGLVVGKYTTSWAARLPMGIFATNTNALKRLLPIGACRSVEW